MSFEEFANEMTMTAAHIETFRRRLIETVVVCVVTIVLCVSLVFVVPLWGKIVFMIIAALVACIGVDQTVNCASEIIRLKAYRQALDEWQGLFYLTEACHA